MFMDVGLKNRKAVVTGASRGIGRAIASRLAAEGARVALVARGAEDLGKVRGSLAGDPERHLVFAEDLLQEGAPERLAARIQAEFGAPEILVHNLGGSLAINDPFAPASDWEKVWRYNVGIGHALNCAFVPDMIEKRWGRIVHVSTLSTRTFNGAPAYVSAKSAVDGYVRTMQRELARHGIVMTAVQPGAIRSEGRYFAKIEREDPAKLQQYFKDHLPAHRLGTGDDVANVVTFLCSEHASFMSGSIVGVDGGGF